MHHSRGSIRSSMMLSLALLLLHGFPLLHATEPLRIAPFKANAMPTILGLFGQEHHSDVIRA